MAKIAKVTDPKKIEKLLRKRGIDAFNAGPAPAIPDASLGKLEFLEAMYEVEKYNLKVAQGRQSMREIPQITKRMTDLHGQLKTLQGSQSTSIWIGTSEEMRARFDRAMVTAPPELLEAAVAESKRRKKLAR